MVLVPRAMLAEVRTAIGTGLDALDLHDVHVRDSDARDAAKVEAWYALHAAQRSLAPFTVDQVQPLTPSGAGDQES